MPLPTTATGPTNVYFCIDDSGTTAGVGPVTGAGSAQQICAEFTATSIANAMITAYLVASALQRPVRLVVKYGGTPPWTLVLNGPAATALTAAPSGTGY